MIKKPTVFIVGAGASVPYGLKTARLLKPDIAPSTGPSNSVKSQLERGADEYQIRWIQKRFLGSPCDSMDQFLENQSPERRTLGKLLLVSVLAPQVFAVEVDEYPGDDRDWLKYLFREMLSGVAAPTPSAFLALNKVHFVTFNFDHAIERVMTRLAANLWFLKDEERRSFERKIGALVVHVHGELTLPNNAQEMTSAWTKQQADMIHLLDDPGQDHALERAERLLSSAETICLLGFSYAESNLNKLNIPEVVTTNHERVLGSCFGMSNNEIRQAWDRVGIRFQNGTSEDDCLEVLRTLPILRG